MTDFLHPGLPHSGLHPDADLLSAFTEQALSAHEREDVLLHLAACARCRDVVALSLPPLEQSPPLAVEPTPGVAGRPARPRWLADWRIWLPTGALAAAALAFAVHVHDAHPAATPAPVETASVSVPPGVIVPQSTEDLPQREAATPLAAAKPQSLNSPAAPAKIPPPPPAPTLGVAGAVTPGGDAFSQQQIQQLPIDGGRFAPLAVPQSSAALHGQAYGQQSVGGLQAESGSQGAQQYRSQAQQQAAPSPPLRAMAPGLQQQESAPPAAPAAAASSAQTVEVSGAMDAVTTDSAELANLLPAPVAPLPSHLPIASSVADAGRTLAIDKAGALFLSRDDGRHWKLVHAPWHSSVAKLVRPGAAVEPTEAKASAGAVRAEPVSAGSASLAGLVTDPTGAIIPGAAVTLTGTRGGAVVAAVRADKLGRYMAVGIAAGTYKVRSEAPGFATREDTVSLAAAEHRALDLQLTVGSTSETVTVTNATEINASPRIYARKAKAAERGSATHLFEVTTASGEHWTSADGTKWQPQTRP